ncbi:cytochrome b/b6 domain-containing protein [Chryseolinea sp. T2]|uniref:cytochrome b/b6 domain-containing protein n=1 Tax=Chryseolinea sp. T2 TaxID=3129255 RepID=UPI003077AB17
MSHPVRSNSRHARWVRISHGVITVSFLSLAVTGFYILMVHPRLYWGEVGNDLTPAFIELPISRNYKHNGWDEKFAYFDTSGSPVSASRTYDIFNENGWGRSLHFLSAWVLVITGSIYIGSGLITRHFGKRMLPSADSFSFRNLWREFIDHLRSPRSMGNGTQYNLLQRITYLGVIFVCMPVVVMTGLAMSPAVAAGFPIIVSMWGGTQSARTIHFFASIAVELFLVVHLVMIIITGFIQNMKAIVIGK